MNLKSKSIAEVLQNLQWCIDNFANTNNPVGFFTAVYKKTTLAVKEGIDNKIFEDNDRMERMDINFANLYFQALENYINGLPAEPHWQITFDNSNKQGLTFGQHFLAAANAHISYDLSLASAITCPGNEIYQFKNDFMKMNGVLASLYSQVNQEISRFCPDFSMIDKFLHPEVYLLQKLLMDSDRNLAWQKAVELAQAGQNNFHTVTPLFMGETIKNAEFILEDLSSNESILFKLGSKVVNEIIDFTFYSPNTAGKTIGDQIRELDNPNSPANG